MIALVVVIILALPTTNVLITIIPIFISIWDLRLPTSGSRLPSKSLKL